MKFLLDFFTKKSRVQGRALPLAAEARESRGQRPLAPAAEAKLFLCGGSDRGRELLFQICNQRLDFV